MNRNAFYFFPAILAAGAVCFFTFSAQSKPPALPVAAAPSEIPPELTGWLDGLSRESELTPLHRPLQASLQAVRLLPLAPGSWVRLGDVLTERSRQILDTSLYPRIERIYLQAHKLDRTDTTSLVGLAWAAGAAHRFDDSVAWALLALKTDPELPAAYGIIGDAAVERGRYEEAALNYQRMLDLKPDLGSYSRAAHLLFLQGEITEALSIIRQALAAGGGEPARSAWCVAELSMMLRSSGDFAASIEVADSWLKRAPNNVVLLNASGQAHLAAGDAAAAIIALEHAATQQPQHETLATLHDLYLAAGRTAEAGAMTARIEELHARLRSQNIQGGEGELSRFYADSGIKLEEAVRFAEAERSHHLGAVAADTLAWAYFRAGRVGAARALVPEILQSRHLPASMLYHVALIEEAAGNTTEARAHLETALNREPHFNPVHAPLARAALLRLTASAAPLTVRR
ncbi:MAG: tetratricopeptide repeat protein [Opitutaceae bacterium]|nr:tetratricopeptide repeat protein [Opitutaceae bacterium]